MIFKIIGAFPFLVSREDSKTRNIKAKCRVFVSNDAPGLLGLIYDESSRLFPPEVIIEILSWLPFKSLQSQVQLVCKEWKAFTQEHYFIEKHSSRCSNMALLFNVKDLDTHPTLYYFRGCNDGLLLVRNNSSYRYFIWNPAISRVLELPDPHDGTYGCALTYVPATRNYRIVLIYKDNKYGGQGCEVFTPGHSKTWRSLPFSDFANANEQHPRKRMFSVVSTGVAVHCVLVIKVGKKIVAEIVTLDLETECFTINHLPEGLFRRVSEMDWHGKLAFADIVGQELQFIELDDYKKQRWSVKKIVPLPFMKKYEYNGEEDVFPVLAKRGQIWFRMRNEKIFIYTIKTGEITDITTLEYFFLKNKFYLYKPSLISFEGMVPATNLNLVNNN